MGERESHAKTSELAANAAEPLTEAVAIMERLRAPNGCPWDREQTFDSIKRHTLEETYEVFDAIERRDWPALQDELGDLLLQVLFYAQMATDARYFTIADVARGLNAKLIRRHPHIFPPENGQLVEATDSGAVLRNWEQIKREEKRATNVSRGTEEFRSGLDDVPRAMPAMLEAAKIGSKAAKVGFDWPDVDGLFAKLEEEAEELRAEIVPRGALVNGEDGSGGEARARVEEELGDLLFTTVNLARHLKVDAEFALRGANAKFRKRFAGMEREAGGYEALGKIDAEGLERLWRAVKAGSSD